MLFRLFGWQLDWITLATPEQAAEISSSCDWMRESTMQKWGSNSHDFSWHKKPLSLECGLIR